jgi:hypothetical protein
MMPSAQLMDGDILAFSAATSYAKSAAQARISIISGRIVTGEGLDGGAK